MDSNVRVAVRCRPLNSKERSLNCEEIVEYHDKTIAITDPDDHQQVRVNFFSVGFQKTLMIYSLYSLTIDVYF